MEKPYKLEVVLYFKEEHKKEVAHFIFTDKFRVEKFFKLLIKLEEEKETKAA